MKEAAARQAWREAMARSHQSHVALRVPRVVLFETNPEALWRFRSTGRQARVLRVRSYFTRDIVEFRFEGDNTVRTVHSGRFLADFERVQ